MASGVLFALVGLFIADAYLDGTLNQIVSGIAFSAIPVAVGVAVLRFHLYDLDVVVTQGRPLRRVRAVRDGRSTSPSSSCVGTWLGRGRLVPDDARRRRRRA